MDYRQIVSEDAKPLVMPDDKTITDLQCKDVDG